MKFLLTTFLVLFGLQFARAQEIPTRPGKTCSQCTDKMRSILDRFHATPHAPLMTPAVYSGDCYFLSPDYRGDQAHRSVVLLDEHPFENSFYFASGFTFFGSPQKYADWTLDFMRERTDGAWNRYGPIETADNSSRIVSRYDNGRPAFIYYLRQDPETRELLYITSWGGGYQTSFCTLTPN